MNKANKKFYYPGFIFLALAFSLFFAQKTLATIYAPGATLEPDCAPGSVNCGVSVPALTNIGNTNLSLTGPRTLTLNGNSLTLDGTTGDLVFNDNGGLSLNGDFATLKGADYPTTGIQNNVNLGSGALFRYTGNGNATFTGIAGGTNGRLIRIINASVSNLTIANQDSASLAANRIITANGASSVVFPDVLITLQYDSASSRWRIVSQPVTDLTASAFVNDGNAFGGTAILGTTDANALNLITSGATRLSLAAGSATLSGTGATSITTDSSLSLSSAAANSLNVTSGTSGTLTLDSGTVGAVNIGNGANAKIITIGNTTGATTLNLSSGLGGITFNGNTLVSGSNTFTTGTGTTTINSTAVTLAGNSTVLDMTGSGTLNLNTINNRVITTGTGLITIGGAATVTGLSILNGNVVANGDVTLGNAPSDRIVFNGTLPGATPIVFDGATGDANFLTLAVNDPTGSSTATIPVLTGDDTFVFQSQSQTLSNKTLVDPILNGNLSGTGIDTDGTLAANSDTKLASQKATKTYVDNKTAGLSFRAPVNLIDFIENNPGVNVVGHTTYTMDGVPITNGMRVIFGNNSVPAQYNDIVFVVGGVGSSITLTADNDGKNNDGTPTEGDMIFILQGTVNGNKTFVWSATAHHWELASSLGGNLLATNNLSDVSDTATARTNLGLGTLDSPTFAGLTINGNISQTGVTTLTTGTGLLTASGDATVAGLLTGQTGAVVAGGDITLNHDSNFNVELATGSSTGTVLIGAGSSPVAVDSTTWDISTLGAASGFTSLSSTGATAISVDSGTTGAVNLGTGANAKIITIGNTTGATALNLNSGSGGINLGGNTTVTGSNTFTTGTGTATFNSPAINLAGNSTVLDMTGTGTFGLNTTTNRAITTGTGLFTSGGDLAVNGSFSALGNFATPKGTDFTTTGTSNNVNFGPGSLFYYAGAAPATITGIAGGTDGRLIRINNTSNFTLIFTNLDAGSLAANLVQTPTGGNLIIAPDVSVQFQYNSTTLTWHVVTLPASATSIGSFAFLQNGNAFGATASLGTTDAFGLNFITSGATRLSLASGSATLTGTGPTSLTTDNTLSLSSAAASALNVTSGTTGALNLDSGTTGAINIGTNANAKTITIGNGAGATSLVLNAGTGNIDIGANAAARTINVGTGAAAQTVNVGSTNGASSLTLQSGTGNLNITTQGTGSLNIGNNAVAQTLNVGNATGATALNLNSGTGGITLLTATTGVVSIKTGTTGAVTLDSGTTGAVNLGTGNNAKTINIGTGTAGNAINIGTSNTTADTISIASALDTLNITPSAQANGNVPLCAPAAGGRVRAGAANNNCNTSSRRFKHDINPLTAGLETLEGLQPVTYFYNDTNTFHYGLIAEDVYTVIPTAVVLDAEGLPYALDFNEITPVMINAIKETAVLMGDTSPTKDPVTGSENGLSTLVATIRTETAHDPVAIIASKIADGKQFLTDFIAARVTAVRGYFDEVFAKKIHTEQICMKKSDGSEVCVDGDKLNALLNNTVAVPTISAPIQSATPAPTTSDVTKPITPAPVDVVTPVAEPTPEVTPVPEPAPVLEPVPAPIPTPEPTPAPVEQPTIAVPSPQ